MALLSLTDDEPVTSTENPSAKREKVRRNKHPLDPCEYSTPSVVTCWNLAWLFWSSSISSNGVERESFHNAQGWDLLLCRCPSQRASRRAEMGHPRGIPSSSNPSLQSLFLDCLLWLRWWELLWEAALQINDSFASFHLHWYKQPSSLPGASAPLKFSHTNPVMLFTVVIWPTYTHCNPFQLFYHFMFLFFFFYFPPSCWHLASTELSRTKHVFKLRSRHYIKKWDYCLYLWEEVSAFTTPN